MLSQWETSSRSRSKKIFGTQTNGVPNTVWSVWFIPGRSFIPPFVFRQFKTVGLGCNGLSQNALTLIPTVMFEQKKIFGTEKNSVPNTVLKVVLGTGFSFVNGSVLAEIMTVGIRVSYSVSAWDSPDTNCHDLSQYKR